MKDCPYTDPLQKLIWLEGYYAATSEALAHEKAALALLEPKLGLAPRELTFEDVRRDHSIYIDPNGTGEEIFRAVDQSAMQQFIMQGTQMSTERGIKGGEGLIQCTCLPDVGPDDCCPMHGKHISNDFRLVGERIRAMLFGDEDSQPPRTLRDTEKRLLE